MSLSAAKCCVFAYCDTKLSELCDQKEQKGNNSINYQANPSNDDYISVQWACLLRQDEIIKKNIKRKKKEKENISQDVFTWNPSRCSNSVKVNVKENRNNSHLSNKIHLIPNCQHDWIFINRSGDLSCHQIRTSSTVSFFISAFLRVRRDVI